MPAHIPSLSALESSDDGSLAAELRLARVRSQVAIVRALADHAETLSRAADAEWVGGQIIEEMARLGCRLLEASQAFVEAPRVEDSGVFARCPSWGGAMAQRDWAVK
jgi:hypothetical protein